MNGFTDIRKKLIDFLPQGLRPYGLLARLDRPVGVWLLLFPCLWAIILAAGGGLKLTFSDFKIIALFAVGSVVMRAAGCVINDLWDRDFDKKVERTKERPLASGALSPKQAFIFLGVLLILGLLILIQLTPLSIYLGFAVMIPIILYPLMKRITYWPQAFLGITFNFGVLIGWAAIAETLPLAALTLYAACIFWTLGYDTIYAHQDIEDDLKIGVKSTAIKFGEHSPKFIWGFYGAFYALLFGTSHLLDASITLYTLLCASALFTCNFLCNWDPSGQQSALDSFKANINLGFLILIAFLF